MAWDLAAIVSTTEPKVLGERIRAARVAAGLTQKDLAAGLISAPYLSRIEAGDRRADYALLTKMSEKLSVSLETLITGVAPDQKAEWRLTVDLAELALSSGNPQQALDGISGLLQEPALERFPRLQKSARRVEARALEAKGELVAAIGALENLTRESAPDLDWINDLIALSRCYRVTGDFGRAVEVGEGAAIAVAEAGLQGTAESIQLALTIAGSDFERGEVERAALICAQAVQAADQLGSPAAIAAAYWNASIIESRRGDAAAALPMVQRALRVLEAGEDARNLARIRNQVGVLQLRLNPPRAAEAKATLDRAAVELAASSASTIDRAHNDLSLARAHYLLGEFDQAERHLADGHAAVRGISPVFEANAFVLQGELRAARGDVAAARHSYRDAIYALTSAGSDRSAGETWYELGMLLDDVGLYDEARNAYRSAAACMGLAPRGAARRVSAAPS